MKVFQVVRDPYKMNNPYVSTLMDGISSNHSEIEWGCGLDNFWKDIIFDYDIVHFHWPHLILQSHLCEINKFEERLEKIKNRGIKIVVTCHNIEPHYTNDNIKHRTYRIAYLYADVIIHLGQYSKNLLSDIYPHAQHIVIFHHIYDNLYHRVKREESIKRLGLDPSKKYILCFGDFRDDEERALVDMVLKEFRDKGVEILAPNYYKIVRRKNIFKILMQWIKCQIKTIQSPGLHINGWYVRNEDLPFYYGASEISLLQRKRILNSGNLPMGLYMANVVVGPNIGNVGEILKNTKNPVFDVNDNRSIVKAIEEAFHLVKTGKNEMNAKYAQNNYSTAIISNQLYNLYNTL